MEIGLTDDVRKMYGFRSHVGLIGLKIEGRTLFCSFWHNFELIDIARQGEIYVE